MNVAFFLVGHRPTKPSAEGNPKSENVAMRDLTPARIATTAPPFPAMRCTRCAQAGGGGSGGFS